MRCNPFCQLVPIHRHTVGNIEIQMNAKEQEMTRYKLGKAVSVAILVAGFSVAPLSAASAQGTDAQDDAGTHENARNHDDRKRGHRMHRRMTDSGVSDPARRIERMLRHLDLDDAQSQRVSNIMTAAEPELRQLHGDLQENRDALRVLDPNEPDYDLNLQNLSTSVGTQATQLALLLGRIRADVNAVLTPQQREKLQEHAARLRERGADGRRHSGDAVPLD